MVQNISPESQKNALQVAKATQKPGQTKEQTKLIAQGIEKGISEYKKQQKIKARERDKQRKQALKNKNNSTEGDHEVSQANSENQSGFSHYLPWVLLITSWIIFTVYFLSLK